MIVTYNNNGHTYEITENCGKKGLESTSGVILLHPVYDSIENFSVNLFGREKIHNYRIERNGKFGLVQACNLELTYLLPIEYDELIQVKANRFLFVIGRKDDKFGLFFDECWYLTLKYDYITVVTYERNNATNQYLLIEKDGKYGALFVSDLNDVPIEYDEILPPIDDFGLRVRKGGTWGYLDNNYRFTTDISQVPLEWDNLCDIRIK